MIKRVDIYAEISKNIKTIRKELHLTQRNIADLTGYSYEFIRRIEAENCPNYFSIGTIYEISLALGIPLVELVKVSFGENSDNMYNNIDLAMPKIEKQIIKNSSRDKSKFLRSVNDPFEFLTEVPAAVSPKLVRRVKVS